MSKNYTVELGQFFTNSLLVWSKQINRNLPWKKSQNPYHIWLSEIILQQTRVEQGTPYFNRFIERFPTLVALALASEDEVLKLWEGLGYYSRARNMHQTAKHIAFERDGVFPNSYQDIRSLKGVGDYTAAAIASFAFDLPYAVVDGNVFRVLARFFGIQTPTDTTAGKKEFQHLAQILLDKTQPAAYNQAIMDFGAVCCVPKSPNCPTCPLHNTCHAFQNRLVETLPIKSKRLQKRTRYFHYLLFDWQGHLLIEKRIEKDIWQGLYQFPLLELHTQEVSWEQISSAFHNSFTTFDAKLLKTSKPYQQTLTHQQIIARFWEIQLSNPPEIVAPHQHLTPREALTNFAFPKIIDNYFQDQVLYLAF